MNRKEKLLNYNMELIKNATSSLQDRVRMQLEDAAIIDCLQHLEQLINDMREDMKLED